MALDQQTLAMAMQHGGVVTRAMLLDSGKSRHWIDREVRAKRLTLLKPGLYRIFELPQHIDVLKAAVTALPDAVVSHESAAHLLRLPVLPELRPTVTVRANTTHLFGGVMVRRADDLSVDHTTDVDDLPTTGVMRTVFDLAGILPEFRVDAIIEALVVQNRLEMETFAEFSRSLARRGKRGSAVTASIIERRLGNGAHGASVLEARGLDLLRAAGIAEPELEYPAPWDHRERLDVAWPPARVGLEWDSRAWHGQLDQMGTDRRRDRAASLAGWVVLRYTWTDVKDRPGAIVSEVSTLLRTRWPRP